MYSKFYLGGESRKMTNTDLPINSSYKNSSQLCKLKRDNHRPACSLLVSWCPSANKPNVFLKSCFFSLTTQHSQVKTDQPRLVLGGTLCATCAFFIKFRSAQHLTMVKHQQTHHLCVTLVLHWRKADWLCVFASFHAANSTMPAAFTYPNVKLCKTEEENQV